VRWLKISLLTTGEEDVPSGPDRVPAGCSDH
jgi:hypothetical protein